MRMNPLNYPLINKYIYILIPTFPFYSFVYLYSARIIFSFVRETTNIIMLG